MLGFENFSLGRSPCLRGVIYETFFTLRPREEGEGGGESPPMALLLKSTITGSKKYIIYNRFKFAEPRTLSQVNLLMNFLRRINLFDKI